MELADAQSIASCPTEYAGKFERDPPNMRIGINIQNLVKVL